MPMPSSWPVGRVRGCGRCPAPAARNSYCRSSVTTACWRRRWPAWTDWCRRSASTSSPQRSTPRRLARSSPRCPPATFLAEPQARNTAAAVGLATGVIAAHDPQATVVSLHADHAIQNPDAFRRVLRTALLAAQRGDYLLTIGIQPAGPATGYGYIHREQRAFSVDGAAVYAVERFVEKPDAATARRFVESGEYFWNAGYFGFQARHFLTALRSYMPALARGVEVIQGAWGTAQQDATLAGVYAELEPIAIDTGVFEQRNQRADGAGGVPLE